ncbi:MAG: methyl-accepting chemotaxis protein [Nodosilinea sp.]
MDKQRFWKLRHWIIAGYSVPIVALVVSAGVTVINVAQLRNYAQGLSRTWNTQSNIHIVDSNLHAISRYTRGYLLEKNPTSVTLLAETEETYFDTLAELKELITNETQKENLALLEEKALAQIDLNRRLIQTVDADGAEAAIEMWKASGALQSATELTELMHEMDTLENEITAEAEELQAAALQRLQFTLITAALTSVVLSILIGTWIVLKASRMMNQAAGDIASSASEIAASVEQQERTSSQQAASVNETSTTMDELGASSRQSSEQAEAAAAGAQQALTLAEGGTRAVERSLDGMTALREKVDAIADQILRLSEQTSQIGGISGLVSDLANQTNMLALNAAVEAVRAGEHGKGFAVVSGEIRKLADQSKKSAEKINALVADIQTAINSTVMVTDEGTKKVEEGVKIAEETADAFAGVADAVNNVVLNSQQISLNVKQQAVAIQQVVSAMNSLNTGAQENANGISQIKVGTHQLNESALLLKVAI